MKYPKPLIALTGASGFIGRALLGELAREFRVRALTRGIPPEEHRENIEWQRCDLFSLLDTEKALTGVDAVVYLVHSMLPASELTQASFQDLDLLVADNVVRSSAALGVKQIIYLSGILPKGDSLSPHLQSRLEVERVLSSRSTALTVLRAGLIVGPEGSSLEILLRLVDRLPLMLCPSWTNTKAEPVAVQDVLRAITQVALQESDFGKVYDLGGGEVLTYQKMMAAAAKLLGKNRFMFKVPLFSPGLSRLWVSCITGAPKNLVAPLIQSLKHEMLPADERRFIWSSGKPIGFQKALEESLSVRSPLSRHPRAFTLAVDERKAKTVLSVQRIYQPPGSTATSIAKNYIEWLPSLMPVFLRVVSNGSRTDIGLRLFSKPLLTLDYSDRSTPDRNLFYIRGGLLAKSNARGRLEFRQTYDPSAILVAVHDFEPALPWRLYRLTQAPLHAWVMKRFERHLRKEVK